MESGGIDRPIFIKGIYLTKKIVNGEQRYHKKQYENNRQQLLGIQAIFGKLKFLFSTTVL